MAALALAIVRSGPLLSHRLTQWRVQSGREQVPRVPNTVRLVKRTGSEKLASPDSKFPRALILGVQREDTDDHLVLRN
jgi:hypothetical protein